MISDTISTGVYVFKNYLRGYRLLKNPKGTSSNEVTMLKTDYTISEPYCDDFFRYSRLNRKKVDGKFVETKKILAVTRFMDAATRQVSDKKQAFYNEIQNGVYIDCKIKTSLSANEQTHRQKITWKNTEEYNNYVLKKMSAQHFKEFFQPPITFAEQLLTFGQAKRFRHLFGYGKNQPVRQSFAKTLLLYLLKK